MGETTPSNGDAGTTGPARLREETTLKITTRVAEAKGCEPWELEPLSGVVDPDAIETMREANPQAAFEIRFDYEGGRVTVTSDGDVDFEFPA